MIRNPRNRSLMMTHGATQFFAPPMDLTNIVYGDGNPNRPVEFEALLILDKTGRTKIVRDTAYDSSEFYARLCEFAQMDGFNNIAVRPAKRAA